MNASIANVPTVAEKSASTGDIVQAVSMPNVRASFAYNYLHPSTQTMLDPQQFLWQETKEVDHATRTVVVEDGKNVLSEQTKNKR
jgi:hypothetical protein